MGFKKPVKMGFFWFVNGIFGVLKWDLEEKMNYLIHQVVEAAAKKWGMRHVGNKWVGQVCPGCGKTGSGNDKFNFWDDGGYKCWSCEKSGDIISWLRGGLDVDFGMTCAEAHEYVNTDCLSSSCPHVNKCRVTTGGRRHPASPALPPAQGSRVDGVNMIEQVIYPHDLWVDRMEKMVQKATGKIGGHPEVLEYLASRGITPEMIDRNRFGYLPHDEKIPVEQLGIVFDPDGNKRVAAGTVVYGKKDLWIPGGIVMPLYHNGKLFAVDIRRPKFNREKFLPNLKYMFIKGGGVSYRVLWDGALGTSPRAVVFIEARLCASLVYALCPDVAIVVGKDKPLPRAYYERFKQAPVILVATDNDTPGKEKARKLEVAFDNAYYWPVPKGKDPGEFFQQGGDVKEWIEEGIAKYTPADGEQYQPTPGTCSVGPVAEGADECDGNILKMTVHGQEIYVADEKALKKSSFFGKVVFTVEEFRQSLATLVAAPEEVALRMLHYQKEGYKNL